MTIALKCSECNTPLKVADVFAGKTCKCPKCAAINTVPPGSYHVPEEFSKYEKTTEAATWKIPKAREVKISQGKGNSMPILRWCFSALCCGLIGGVTLTLLTLIKMIRVIPRLLTGEVILSEALFLPVAVFLMGFICGVLTWAMHGLSRRFGMLGDAVIGIAVMNVFFLSCMLLFATEMLYEKLSGGLMMLGLASIAGLIIGPSVGHSLRKELTS